MGEVDGKKALSGAATGAAAGSVFGPWGTAIGAGGGLLISALGDLFSDEPSTAEAYSEKIARMQQGANRYEQYRPQVQDAREQALRQQLSAFNGAGNAMGLMYGAQYKPSMYAPNLGVNPYAHGFAPAPPPQPQQQPQVLLTPPTTTVIDQRNNIWKPTSTGYINEATGEMRPSGADAGGLIETPQGRIDPNTGVIL